jgi:predicted transcriptional regulator
MLRKSLSANTMLLQTPCNQTTKNRQNQPNKDILEQSEYIKPIRTSSNAIFYQITGKGIEAYSEWIKDFLNFARAIYNAEDII